MGFLFRGRSWIGVGTAQALAWDSLSGGLEFFDGFFQIGEQRAKNLIQVLVGKDGLQHLAGIGDPYRGDSQLGEILLEPDDGAQGQAFNMRCLLQVEYNRVDALAAMLADERSHAVLETVLMPIVIELGVAQDQHIAVGLGVLRCVKACRFFHVG